MKNIGLRSNDLKYETQAFQLYERNVEGGGESSFVLKTFFAAYIDQVSQKAVLEILDKDVLISVVFKKDSILNTNTVGLRVPVAKTSLVHRPLLGGFRRHQGKINATWRRCIGFVSAFCWEAL
jgi:hypothetical protein